MDLGVRDGQYGARTSIGIRERPVCAHSEAAALNLDDGYVDAVERGTLT